MKNRKNNYFFEAVIFLIFLVALVSILIHFSKKPKTPLLKNGYVGGKAIQNPPDKNTPSGPKTTPYIIGDTMYYEGRPIKVFKKKDSSLENEWVPIDAKTKK